VGQADPNYGRDKSPPVAPTRDPTKETSKNQGLRLEDLGGGIGRNRFRIFDAGLIRIPILFEFGPKFHVFRHDHDFGMGFSIGPIPAFLSQSTHDPDSPALVSQAVAIFRQFGPGFHLKKAYFFFVAVVLFVKAIGSQAKGTNRRSLGGRTEQGVPNQISFD